jgi:putative phosphoesterase
MREISNISKIGVISDTHLNEFSGPLPPAVMEHFKNTGLIIHCGDIVSQDVLTSLGTLAPVIAVKGNMDPPGLSLPLSEMILVNKTHVICVSHGNGSPFGIKQKLYKEFIRYKPSIILYGHTHIAGECGYNGIRFFNPGSPCSRAEYFSVGMINIYGNELKTHVIVI